jgi:hypothetical protein
MRRLCPLKPHVKKGSAEDRHRLRLPQYTGNPGWLLLTHNEEGDPVALFVDKNDNLTVLYIVFDERVFSDTVFRVVRTGPSRFIVYDIRYLNGQNYYETHTYEERSQKVAELLDMFHSPDMVALETVQQIAEWEYPIRGYECYDDKPGTLGVFLPAVN